MDLENFEQVMAKDFKPNDLLQDGRRIIDIAITSTGLVLISLKDVFSPTGIIFQSARKDRLFLVDRKESEK